MDPKHNVIKELKCMFYTFKLLPQLKIGRIEPAEWDFFSQIAL